MANEITVSVNVEYSKGNDAFTSLNGPLHFTQNGKHRITVKKDIALLPTTIDFSALIPEIVTPGFLLLVNTDTTNYVVYNFEPVSEYVANDEQALKLKAGEPALMRLNAGTLNLNAQAFGAPVTLAITLFED